MMELTTRRPGHRRRRGTILIVTMFIVFTLASLVLVMGASMRVEGMAAANMTASLQASTVERGAEQYVVALLTEQKDTLSDLTEDYFAAVQVGDGYFWIVRPDYGDDNLPVFGLTEENAKLNLNTASYESLMRLPNMTDDVASAIIDWRGASAGASSGSSSSSSGGQSAYYGSLPDPYHSKQAPFESVEEMLLVQGASRQLLYGTGDAAPLGTASTGHSNTGSGTVSDLQTANGIYDLLTVYSSEKSGGQQVNINDPNARSNLRDLLSKQLNDPSRADAIVSGLGRNSSFKDVFDFYLNSTPKLKPDEFSAIYSSITAKPVTLAPIGGNGGGATGGGAGGGAGGAAGGAAAAAAVKGRINVNTAPRDVLLTLPGLEDGDVDRLISQRQGAAAGDTSVAWVADALDKKAIGLGNLITGTSYQYSADIVAVSGNGRAYKRCRIVVNAAGTTPQIVYRRDLTDRGWPMDPEILASLRSGQGQQSWAGARGAMPGGSFR
jgi:type II secretory pathway component PulK